MLDSSYSEEILSRRTFAIISHPDAGKTTLTEKLLLWGGVIQLAGTVKARKAAHHATSDWMALEKERGISVSTSVMQFPYQGCIFNLLDTPGHADFSEDTYRTLTAVDSALMVIDAAKGVEPRTQKLLEICRLRQIPILTFINKMDREARTPIELLDDIESTLGISCAPMTWPIGMGKQFKGIYHIQENKVYFYAPSSNLKRKESEWFEGLDNIQVKTRIGFLYDELQEELALIQGACPVFNEKAYRDGTLTTPVFFGSAINNFGIQELLEALVKFAPFPQPRETDVRLVKPEEANFSGFVFKIQANMDPAHRDRIAFLRLCSGKYTPGMKLYQVRTRREVAINNALTFMAGDCSRTEEAWPGDIIGLHNHGTIQIGDSFTSGEILKFVGIPSFSPELFQRVRLKDPLKSKALLKELVQLSEEGAIQIFRPLAGSELILGAIGILQFDVVAYRLKYEYKVECAYEAINVVTARWVSCNDSKRLEEFQAKAFAHLALDSKENLAYLAPSYVNLNLTIERWPEINFSKLIKGIKMLEEKGQRLPSIIRIARDAVIANRAKSKFVANLSYELRSALTSIVGMAQLLSMDCLLPTQEQCVTDILNVSESILPLINRLLNLSERETQHVGVIVQAFNLKKLLEKVVKQLVFQAKSAGIQFLLDYPNHVPVNVIGDPHLIHQIVLHLSSYALKNTEQGSIIIQIDYSQNEQEGDFDEFSVHIQDSGKGMQEKELKKLMACLDQSYVHLVQDYRSIDLGMAITLAYIKLLKAKLEIESTPEKGSLFICRIPLKRQTNAAYESLSVPREDSSFMSGHKLRILLIEDNELIQRIYKSMLEKIEGCFVDSAINAQMALEYYMQYSYDLIFMDICLPDSNGITITQIIRQQEVKGERIPIIAITAHGDAKDKEAFLKAGIDEVLIKPINLEEIMVLLERWAVPKNMSSNAR